MKTTILAGVATLALGVASAMAQNAPATPATPGASNAGNSQFIDKQSTDEFRAPKLIGVSVYDNANKSVGKITDLLLDKDGTVKAVVIGIGGFLGIDQKDVAVPYSAVHWQTEQRTVATGAAPAPIAMTGSGSGGMGGTAANGTTPGAMGGAGAPSGNLANKPVPSTMAAATPSDQTQTRTAKIDPARTEAYQGYPDRAVIDMSQSQLKSAPEFKYASNPAEGAMGATGAGGMTGTRTDNAKKP